MDLSALHVNFLNRERVVSKRRVCASMERQETIERTRQDWRVEIDKAAKSAGGSHSVPNRRPPRPMQVAKARHRRPLSSSHWVACSSSGGQVARRLPGRHSSVAANRCTAVCSAQYLGKTATLVPSRWSFARRHMLGTGELMWTSVKRVGTRRIHPSLVP